VTAVETVTDDPASRPNAARTVRGMERSSKLAIAVTLAVAVIYAFPIVWAALSSFKSTSDVLSLRYPLTWKTFIPPRWTLENYVTIFTSFNFQRSLYNTAIASFGQVTLAVISSTLAGYVFARLRFPGRDIVFGLLLLTSFIPLEVILVPLYNVVSGMGLASTYPALFLPFSCSPFGIYLMRQGFLSIPTALDDAARVDGASTWKIFWRIALPNVKPALATLVLIQFIWSWNNYLWPLVIMQKPEMQIAQVALTGLNDSQNYVRQTHLKDGIAVSGPGGLASQVRDFGTGMIDFAEIIPILAAENPRLNLSLENQDMRDGPLNVHPVIEIDNADFLAGHPDLSIEERDAFMDLVQSFDGLISRGERLGIAEFAQGPFDFESVCANIRNGFSLMRQILVDAGLSPAITPSDEHVARAQPES
jgi:ABC-type glycerol-3-phosphate transport system permease component